MGDNDNVHKDDNDNVHEDDNDNVHEDDNDNVYEDDNDRPIYIIYHKMFPSRFLYKAVIRTSTKDRGLLTASISYL